MEPCTYEAGDIEYAAECGTLVVPENRSDPESRLIALPVIRILATGSKSSEPILRFKGGPGDTNMKFSHLEGLIENHDIVLVGYRGIDGSVNLQLPEVMQAIKGVGDDLFRVSLVPLGLGSVGCFGYTSLLTCLCLCR